jgi:hypothetical protein
MAVNDSDSSRGASAWCTAVAFVGMVIYSGLEPRFLSTLLMSRLTVE